MLEPNVRLSHLPQASAIRAFSVLIRFYISIEDGEWVVERDLGELTECQHSHTISGTEFDGTSALADDVMLARGDSTTAADIRVGGPGLGSCARLGPGRQVVDNEDRW